MQSCKREELHLLFKHIFSFDVLMSVLCIVPSQSGCVYSLQTSMPIHTVDAGLSQM